jgi:hypothetical protein
MSCWTWIKGSSTISVFTSNDQGDTWQDVSVELPFRPDNYGDFDLSWTPGGDLLGRRPTHQAKGLQLWRAPAEDGAEFALVLDTTARTLYGWIDLPLVVDGTRIVASTLWSEDDGRTWSEITPWRP